MIPKPAQNDVEVQDVSQEAHRFSSLANLKNSFKKMGRSSTSITSPAILSTVLLVVAVVEDNTTAWCEGRTCVPVKRLRLFGKRHSLRVCMKVFLPSSDPVSREIGLVTLASSYSQRSRDAVFISQGCPTFLHAGKQQPRCQRPGSATLSRSRSCAHCICPSMKSWRR